MKPKYQIETKDGRINCSELTRYVTGTEPGIGKVKSSTYLALKLAIPALGHKLSSWHHKV